ncbi:lytic polysaccharide monooxygenase [Lentzea tibetensis]|uniref:Lytic polysaccharide monooxygenase n=1 Tax=Lentzea tibetensis TaxID=2591470 RepID=A0A563ETH5_9PSEU|nr:lytic polysaccharide monooxygenase [Lentzea tibetensis]TWP51025.1 lytic polysaccharide monooxygenase [Lentzea tibetensis]
MRLFVACFLIILATAATAQAHGAPSNPPSRAYLCAPDQPSSATDACKAAAAWGLPAKQWDNIRRPNIAGRDRQLIPDGKLCSAGIPAYQGLDQPREDWPTTQLKNQFRYVSTIPHRGTFRFFVTKDGYDPTKPLKWEGLDEFQVVKDPKLVNGAYTFDLKLPQDKSGRHLIYTVWQNSDTVDTYYSCTDVIIGATAKTAGTSNSLRLPLSIGVAVLAFAAMLIGIHLSRRRIL